MNRRSCSTHSLRALTAPLASTLATVAVRAARAGLLAAGLGPPCQPPPRTRPRRLGFADDPPGPPVEVITIQFRKGNLVQSVVVAGPQGAPMFDEAFALAQLAASRLPD